MIGLQRVLVVGGGIGGMATIIMLARAGITCDMIDIDPEWRVYGAGISISGPTFRAFGALGVMGEIEAKGHVGAGMRLCAADGTMFAEIPPSQQSTGGGIMRPVLHRILADRVKAAGTNVRLGLSVAAIAQDDSGVDVRFTDGTAGRYDLVVASDGIYSNVRTLLFPNAPAPEYTGQGCWRVMTSRPPELDRSTMYFAGIKAGMTMLSPTEIYMYTLQELPGNPRLEPADYPELLRTHLAPFGGMIGQIRDALGPGSNILYRPLEKLLVPAPWYRGRVILIGDAVHATTPHLASGAGLAVEDAVVLSELLGSEATLAGAFARFMERRYERCRIVVENSVRIGELEMAGASNEEQGALLQQSMAVLATPM